MPTLLWLTGAARAHAARIRSPRPPRLGDAGEGVISAAIAVVR